MKNKIYKKLKEMAIKNETISYSQLAAELNIPYTSIDERNRLHSILGEISKDEVKKRKPMLSVLVHHKGDVERTPGLGFFNLAGELNQRKAGETNKQLQYRIIKECWRLK